MNKLAAYKLDKSFTDGVEIRLDDAPDVVFLVRLPSTYNRGYSQALYSGLKMSLDDSGEVKTDTSNLMSARYVQEDAFVEYCLVSQDGEPIEADFQKDYPDAVVELMNKASDLVSAIEDKVSDAVGKSQASSSGKADGQAKKSSTLSLSSAAG
jgi:hypothetical protein